MVYPFNEILFDYQKESNTLVTSWINFGNIMLSERSENTEGYVLYDSIYMEYLGQKNLQGWVARG